MREAERKTLSKILFWFFLIFFCLFKIETCSKKKEGSLPPIATSQITSQTTSQTTRPQTQPKSPFPEER